MSIYDYQVVEMDGTETTLEKYKGKVLLIVNTASKCGHTPQFEGLEKLYKTYQSQGFEILGFPCNQFLKQDPKSNKEILEFCQLNYGVTFPMHQKIDVKGKEAHPLYKFLVEETGGKGIGWNFTKFLIDRNGNVIKRILSKEQPESFEEDVKKEVEKK